MVRDKIEDFKERFGLTALAGLDAQDGVRADWPSLPEALALEVKGLRLDWEQVDAREPGLVESDWSWRRRQQQVSVSVFVSGTGPGGARAQLLERATDTTTMESPLVPGPPGLGDLAAQDINGPHQYVIWLFRNVCVEVDNEGTGIAILPIAHGIQAFMQAHLVQDIAPYIPRIEGVELSPNPVSVGDTLAVKVRLSADLKPETLTTSIRERGQPHLEWLTEDGLEATLQAVEPGRVELEIIVVDARTLLSPKVGVFVDVVPAR